MIIVNLWDKEFAHTEKQLGFDGAGYNKKPTKIQYVRNQLEWDGITLFTNSCLEKVDEVKSKIKVAWMLEARSINTKSYEVLQKLEDKFDYILTYYEDLLERNPTKYLAYIMGCCRIPEEEQQIYPKTKLLSHLVTNNKTTFAHIFRHTLATFFQVNNLPISIFGERYTPYPTKLEAHKDFMFSIVIMNSSENFFITEWLIDCLLCGTIPIFYGCPKIHFFFNIDGIIQIHNPDDILNILPTLTPQYYESKRAAIVENFHKAKAFQSPDDMIAEVLMKIPI
jgi:hypothetical protein